MQKRPVRIATKAIIRRNGRLLVQHKQSANGSDYYTLPGGGQERGETLEQALIRECHEELGVTVTVGMLRFVREHLVINERDDVHQVDLIFICTIADDAEPIIGAIPDDEQIGAAWLPIDRLAAYRLYPSVLAYAVPQCDAFDLPVYLGNSER